MQPKNFTFKLQYKNCLDIVTIIETANQTS